MSFFIKRLYYKLKVWTYNKPNFYFSYYRIFGKKRELMVNPYTSIIIEGYPRSANTFFVVVAEKFLKEKSHVAHHLHNPCQLMHGVDNGILSVLLIRKPEDAVLSYVIRNGMTLENAFIEYIKFHEALIPYLKMLIVFNFDYVTSYPNECIKKLIRIKPELFIEEEIGEIKNESIFKQLDHISQRNFNKVSEIEVARPSKRREQIKRLLESELHTQPVVGLFEKAKEIYTKFTNFSI